LAEEVVLWLCWLPLVRERELWPCEPSPRPKTGEVRERGRVEIRKNEENG
jgi:hypothetical protein